jgi:hypothetical protein
MKTIIIILLGFLTASALAQAPQTLKPQKYVSVPKVNLHDKGQLSPDFHRLTYSQQDDSTRTYFARNMDTGAESHLTFRIDEDAPTEQAAERRNLTFSPDSKILAWSYRVFVGSDNPYNPEKNDLHFEFLNAETLTPVPQLKPIIWKPEPDDLATGYDGEFYFSPDGSLVLIRSEANCKAQLIDVKTGKIVNLDFDGICNTFAFTVTFSADNSRALVGLDGNVFAMDMRTGAKIWSRRIDLGHNKTLRRIDFFDGKKLLMLGYGSAEEKFSQMYEVLDSATGALVQTFGNDSIIYTPAGFKSDTIYDVYHSTAVYGGAFLMDEYDMTSNPAQMRQEKFFGSNLSECPQSSSCEIETSGPIFDTSTQLAITQIFSNVTKSFFPVIFDLQSGGAKWILDTQGKKYYDDAQSNDFGWNEFSLSRDRSQVSLRVNTSQDQGFFIFQVH